MKVDSITFETIGGTTRDDLRIKRYEFLKTAKNLHNCPENLDSMLSRFLFRYLRLETRPPELET